jgi:hypothetical protein
MTTYYLADKTKEWNLKLFKIPTDGSFNLIGDIFSASNVSNISNLSLGFGISKNIDGSNNVSIGFNACSKINNVNRNIGIGWNALTNLNKPATGLSSITLLSGGNYNYVTSGTYPLTITVASGPTPITMPTATYTYVATFTSQSGWFGNVTGATLTNSGSGFTSSTTFTFTTPLIAQYVTGSPATFSAVYSSTNSGNDNLRKATLNLAEKILINLNDIPLGPNLQS